MTAQSALTEPRRIGPYVLVQKLGEGGFAPVWLAKEMFGEAELRSAAVKVFDLARIGGRHTRDSATHYRGTLRSMKLAQSRVTAQGQISVPAEVRKRLALAPGSILEWDAEGDRVTVRRVGRHSFDELHRVLFPEAPPPRSIADLEEGVRAYVRSRHARR